LLVVSSVVTIRTLPLYKLCFRILNCRSQCYFNLRFVRFWTSWRLGSQFQVQIDTWMYASSIFLWRYRPCDVPVLHPRRLTKYLKINRFRIISESVRTKMANQEKLRINLELSLICGTVLSLNAEEGPLWREKVDSLAVLTGNWKLWSSVINLLSESSPSDSLYTQWSSNCLPALLHPSSCASKYVKRRIYFSTEIWVMIHCVHHYLLVC